MWHSPFFTEGNTKMTEYEKMTAGEIYDPLDDEIMREQSQYQDRLWAFNQLKPTDHEEKQAYMKEVFAECGEGCYIELPFHANWGGRHVHFGSYVYANLSGRRQYLRRRQSDVRAQCNCRNAQPSSFPRACAMINSAII